MIGPRARGPRKFAREAVPERAVPGERISSFDIVITWVTLKASASCVTPSRRQATPYAIAGFSTVVCTSHDETVAGIKPARPYRMNWVTPLSGPREP
jgi:hypothetical protein